MNSVTALIHYNIRKTKLCGSLRSYTLLMIRIFKKLPADHVHVEMKVEMILYYSNRAVSKQKGMRL